MTLVDIEARPALDHLLDMRIAFHPAQIIPTPVGLRMAYAIRDGRFEGAVSGEVLPGGGDSVLLGTDQVARLDVRATLRTDDGALIHLTNTGRIHMSPEAMQRFATGELIRHHELYGRSSPLFDTADERYHWLTALHTVAINEVSLSAVHYRVFALR